jgi:hypothetical protein
MTGVVWTKTAENAAAMATYALKKDLVPRFSWSPILREEARVLVEPEEGEQTSPQWVMVHYGDRVYRVNEKDPDSPLRIERKEETRA